MIFRIIADIPDNACVEKDCSVFVKDKNEYDPKKKYNAVKYTVIGFSIGHGKHIMGSYFQPVPKWKMQKSMQKVLQMQTND